MTRFCRAGMADGPGIIAFHDHPIVQPGIRHVPQRTLERGVSRRRVCRIGARSPWSSETGGWCAAVSSSVPSPRRRTPASGVWRVRRGAHLVFCSSRWQQRRVSTISSLQLRGSRDTAGPHNDWISSRAGAQPQTCSSSPLFERVRARLLARSRSSTSSATVSPARAAVSVQQPPQHLLPHGTDSRANSRSSIRPSRLRAVGDPSVGGDDHHRRRDRRVVGIEQLAAVLHEYVLQAEPFRQEAMSRASFRR